MRTINNVGDYDRRFRVESITIVTKLIGNTKDEIWNTYISLWGKYMPQGGKEQFEAGQQVATGNVKIKTKWASGVTERMRIVDVIYGGTYDIQNVIGDKREDYLLITAVSRDNKP